MNPIRYFESLNPKWYVTSPYGQRTGRYAGFHNGVDLGGGGGCGAPIKTPYGGKVRIATGQGMGTWGNTTVIEIAPGLLQLMSHHSTIKCKVGDVVKQGDVVAFNGGTNNTATPYGCHIHYEIRIDDGTRAVGIKPWGDPQKFSLEQKVSSLFKVGDLARNTAETMLNVRTSPDGKIIPGGLAPNEIVMIEADVLNGTYAGGHYWWRTDKGWAAGTYLQLTGPKMPSMVELNDLENQLAVVTKQLVVTKLRLKDIKEIAERGL